MMYSNNFVVCVKVNGKVLKEYNDVVKLPFGTEYSILLKNLNSKKAVAQISVDGEEVCNGHWLIIEPNSTTELKGFMKGSVAENSFRFVERTEKIEDHRGIRPDDGTIRVEYRFEIDKPKTTVTPYWIYPSNNEPWINIKYYGSTYDTYSTSDFVHAKGSSAMSLTSNDSNVALGATYNPENENGITVPGQDISQSFNYGYVDTLEINSHVITLKLTGYNEEKGKLQTPVFVREKVNCPTCGTRNHIEHKYCTECGTHL